MHPTFIQYCARQTLAEGGNVVVKSTSAEPIDIRLIDRDVIVRAVQDALLQLNKLFAAKFGEPIWKNIEVLNGVAFNGSSEMLFDKATPTEWLLKHKPTFGDLDLTVPGEHKLHLGELLESIEGQNITGNCKYIGSNKDAETIGDSHQYNCVFQFNNLSDKKPTLNAQIDFELTAYEGDKPSEFTKFAHSSHPVDLERGIKGAIHKFLMVGLTSANSLITPAEATFVTAASTFDKYKVSTSAKYLKGLSKLAFSVDKGLRTDRLVPVLGPGGAQLMINGKPAWKEKETAESEYTTNLADIAAQLFQTPGQPFDLADLPKLWSATGMIELMEKYLDHGKIQMVFDKVVDRLFGKGAQHISKIKEDDQKVKMAAWALLIEAFPFIDQTEAKQLFNDYYAGFDQRQAELSRRKGIGEAVYPGNTGAMEVTKFFLRATEDQKRKFKDLVKAKSKSEVWDLIHSVIGGDRLIGAEFS